MITCYMNKRNRKYIFDFFMRKDFIYGTFNGIEYITNGNIIRGKMKLYVCYGNGWHETNVNVKDSLVAKTVEQKYGEVIKAKNEKYKGSMKSIVDANAWRQKTYGRELGTRVAKPYNGAAWDAKYRVAVACRNERKMGL